MASRKEPIRVSFYARDAGPGNNNIMLAYQAKLKRNWRLALVGNDELGAKDMLIPRPDALIMGLSASRSKEGRMYIEDELELIERATSMSNPPLILVIGDVHYTCVRPLAKGRINKAIALVPSPMEINEALDFGYARAEYLCMPPMWQRYLTVKPVDLSQPAGELIILCVGGHSPHNSNSMVKCLIDAMEMLGWPWKLIFKPHPFEEGDNHAFQEREGILSRANLIEVQQGTSDLIASVDCFVAMSGSTDGIGTCLQRRRVINFENSDIRKRLKGAIGRPDWFPAVHKAAVNTTNADEMASAIDKLFTQGGLEELQKTQIKVYPIEEGMDPITTILDFIEKEVDK